MSEKKSIFIKPAPDRIEYRGGGGCLSLFGLPFLLAGLFIIQIPLGIIPVAGDAPPWYFLVLFGLPFAAVGAGLVFGRNAITIDLSKRQIEQWWGLMIPFKRKSIALDVFKKVNLSKISGDSDSSDNYPLTLVGQSTTDSLKIHAPTDYHIARLSAEELCRFLNFVLEDESSGVKIIRQPHEFNESLRDYIRRTEQDTHNLPPRPVHMQSNIRRNADGYIIEIPWPVRKKAALLGIILSFVFAAIVVYFFLLPILILPMHENLRLLLAGIIILFFILGPIWTSIQHLHKKKKYQSIISFTPAFLRIEETLGRKKKIIEIPLDELEELILPTKKEFGQNLKEAHIQDNSMIGETGIPRLPDGKPYPKILHSIIRNAPHPGITVRSDKYLLNIGRGLEEEELLYLYAFMRKTIAG